MFGPRRLAILFLAMAGLLIGGAVVLHEMGRVVLAANDEVQRRHHWSARLGEVVSILREAETGQRGFLLTGREEYLRPYDEAVSKIDARVAELDTDIARTPAFVAGLAKLKSLIDTKMAELAETIRIRRTEGFDAALKIVATDQGMNTMHQLRQASDELNKLDEAELAAAQSRVEKTTLTQNVLRIAITSIDVVFLAGVYRKIVGDRAERERVAAEVFRQRELLSVTLASIGDAVIVTDVDQRITFVNAVAEELLKTPAAQAIGRPCVDVFNIINEHTRQTVESPVQKVIDTGRIVGLANHTLLIRPDGSELPIDDAGSPVRDAAGKLHGVVLIFRDFSIHRDNAMRLQATNDELAAANKAKDQFTAMLSHELRTPLTPVIGTLAHWESSPEFPEPLREDLKMIRWNVELEARLIDDLLEMTRLSTGKLTLNRETVNVHDALEAVVKMYDRELEAKKIQLEAHLDAADCHASADNARLHQIFWNILKNAVKFTPKGGTVAIHSRCGDGMLQIEFRDSGIGMSPETLGRIFRPLEQGGADITRRFGGLGLGMAISKSLVEAQDGKLVASSAGIGSGSSFTVTLPTVAAPMPVVAVKSETAPAVGRPLHILLVEDHPDTAAVIRLLLKRSGHTVDVAGTVAMGVEMFGKQPFDLLLSDLGLPDGTGIDLIHRIREKSNLPAIALTGYGMDDDVTRCLEAGFNRHLTKPVNINQLVVVIKELIPD